ncbi:DDE-type integrase/transposase/recombinase [Duganella sp. FT80W]|uniref:DDE-type integrase/transposase/recombinase n=1 Tax=Duganella guangzhouensis TaxID=2666084 RepID=A0A6I2L9D4_9BURK|nr:DDE-type integrase/transposase/recombinase [Duganella guangzhouensis]
MYMSTMRCDFLVESDLVIGSEGGQDALGEAGGFRFVYRDAEPDSKGTFQRWVRDGDDAVAVDSRTTSARPEPVNSLSEDERAQILAVANSEEFGSLPPSQIVPALADRGVYIASESSFYRVLKAASQQHHGGRAKKPTSRVLTSHCATGPNQVWSWDIAWLQAAVKGQYYYWYMVLDIFSRKIVGHEVHVAESAELASLLMRRASLVEGLAGRLLVLHSDNGSAMKGSTMPSMLEQLSVAPSFSWPRVSNDNAYLHAKFIGLPRLAFGDALGLGRV